MNRIKMAACLAMGILNMSSQLEAQIVPITEDDINAAPPQFRDILRGKSQKIDQTVRPSAAPTRQTETAHQASSDPRDFSGLWTLAPTGGPPGGPPGIVSGAPDGKRPGVIKETKVEVARICLVEAGVAQANATVYQTPKQVTFVYANELRARRIYLNEPHPANVQASYAGHSVGRWEQDTLAVDTIGFKPTTLGPVGFDVETGAFAILMTTPTLHVTERIRKINDGAQLEDLMHFEDAAAGMQPYDMRVVFNYSPKTQRLENYCEDFNDAFGPDYAK